jgi:hypothetical protein
MGAPGRLNGFWRPLLAAARTPFLAARARAPAQVEAWPDRPQGLDARRERVTIVSSYLGKLFDQSGGLFVG